MATIAFTLAAQNQAKITAQGWLGNTFNAFRAAIEGSKFDGTTKANFAPLPKVPGMLGRLREAGFQVSLDDALVASLQTHLQEAQGLGEAAKARLEAIEAKLAERGLNLYPFQRIGVEWLAAKSGALLASEMGTGKTIQALVAMPEGRGVLIVCPAVAKGVWAREAAKWRPDLTIVVLAGRGSFRWPANGEMVIVNYDILPDPAEAGQAPDGATLVADEAHALKNSKARRSQKFRAISDSVRGNSGRTWLLTATPLLNRPNELWSLLAAAGIERDVFGSYKQFFALFDGRKDRWGGTQWGTPDPSIPSRMQRVSLRHLRADVLPDLPVKTWQDVLVTPSREALRACEALEAALEEAGISIDAIDEAVLKSAPVLFTEVSRFRTLLAAAKIPALLEFVTSYEEQDEPLVVFSAHRAPIDLFAEREGWAVITGDTPPPKRTDIENRFQAGELKGVAATIQAGGVAITLTKSAHAVFVDRDWTPALNSQAEDRICILHGQLVHTLRGTLPIEEVLAGDCVFTHGGNWSRVEEAWSRQHRGLMTEIQYTRHASPLVSTHDHKILVCKKGKKEPDWVEAHDVMPGDFLVLPRMKFPQKGLKTIGMPPSARLKDVQYNQFGAAQKNGRRKPLPEELEVTDELLEIFGWYLAEGFVSLGSGKGRFVSFGLNGFDEVTVGRRIAKFFKEKFGINAHTTHEGGKYEIRLYSADLAFFFAHYFRNGSRNLHIREDIFLKLSSEQVRILLRGYFAGDGYARKRQQEWTSASDSLMYQVSIWCAGLGWAPSIREHGTEDAWVGYITIDGAPSNRALSFIDEDYVYHPVRSVLTRFARRHRDVEMVRDLTVAGDESFVVGLAAVHNCRIGQTRGAIITNFVLDHSLDKRVTALLTKKTALVNASLPTASTPRDSGQAPVLTAGDLAEFVAAMEAVEAEKKLKQLPLRRMPLTAQEFWAVESLQKLAAWDQDHASEENGVGFNRLDGGIGHSLAKQSVTGLSTKQYALAFALLKKYHGQIGRCS